MEFVATLTLNRDSKAIRAVFIPIIVLLIVFVLIAVRRIGAFRLRIWQIMLGGAVAVLVLGQISPLTALLAINLDVMLFLFGMFVVGVALEESGYLQQLTQRLFRRTTSPDLLLLLLIFGFGLLSALLMNDTIAIIGTPMVILLARKHNLPSRLTLLGLAFAVTTGSVMSPIGNPQNLLIAINGGIVNPFVTFFTFLFVPTAINLGLVYLLLRVFYRKALRNFVDPTDSIAEPVKDARLALLAKVSLLLIVVLIAVKIALVFLMVPVDFKLTYIAIIAALPVLLFSSQRVQVLKKVDWYTLVFFAAMFVLMESVWLSGFFQGIIAVLQVDITAIPILLALSVLFSQLISNVPLVALFLPLLASLGASTQALMALAAGSTIAGNLTILGAASNVIIIQNAETKAGETLTLTDFVKVGAPLTILNVIVYWAFLTLL